MGKASCLCRISCQETEEESILFRYHYLSLTKSPPLLSLPCKGSFTSTHRDSSPTGNRLCVHKSVWHHLHP